MNQIATDLWPFFVTAVVTMAGTYIGAIHSLRLKVVVLEQKVENLQKRVDSHSQKTDDLLDSINKFKLEINSQLSNISNEIAAITTMLNIMEPLNTRGKKNNVSEC